MANPALADLADVEARLGTTVNDGSQVEALIVDASALVRAYAGETWTDAEGALEELPDGIVGVVSNMVIRALQNPTGVTQETTGPFSVSYGTAASARLYLTGSDKQIIDAAVGSTGGLWTLATTRDADLIGLETPPVRPEWATVDDPTLGAWETA